LVISFKKELLAALRKVKDSLQAKNLFRAKRSKNLTSYTP
jgi:hypothetical protein